MQAIRNADDQKSLARMLHSVNRANRAEYDRAKRVEYYYCAQLINHTFGHAETSLDFRERISSENGSGETAQWMAASNRLAIQSALDLFDADRAEKIADETEALVLFNSGHEIITRSDADVSAETWGLYVQIYLLREDRERAAEYLEKMNRAILRERERVLKITKPSHKRLWGEYLAELDAASELYAALLTPDSHSRIDEETKAGWRRFATDTYSRQTRARFAVCAGDWHSGNPPPAGISFAEALRFAFFARRASRSDLPASSAQLFAAPFPSEEELENEDLEETALAAVAPPAVSPQFSIEQFVTQIAQTVASAVNAGNQHPQATVSEGFRFERLDILNQLAIAAQQAPPFTGYFHLRWNTEKIRTSVLARKISERVLCGEAYIFMVSGYIVDATLGAYDAPKFADEAAARSDARETMCILLRLGLGIDLDNFADGFAVSHESAAVAERAARLRMAQIHLSALLADIETGADLKPPEISESPTPLVPPVGSPIQKTLLAETPEEDILSEISDFETSADQFSDDLLEL